MSENTKVRRSLTEQGALMLTARIIGFILSVALPLLLVRRLNQAEFGVYKQVFLIIVTVSNILPFGFSMSAYYFLPREDDAGRRKIIFNILLFNFIAGFLAFAVLFFAPHLLAAIFHNDAMTAFAPFIGLIIWAWLFSSFVETVAVANQEPRVATMFIVLAQLTKTVLLVAAAAIFGTVESLIFAALTQAVLQTIVLLVYLNSRFPRFWMAFDAAAFWRQTTYAVPLGFAGILWTLQLDLHNYFVSNKFTPAEFAIYSIGCFQLPLVGMLADAVGSVLIPRMSELQSADKRRQMFELVIVATERLALVFFPLYIFLLITTREFVVALFTENYLESVPIFRINLILLPFYAVTLDSIVRAFVDLGRMLLILRIFIFAAMIAALTYGVSNFGLQGMIAIVVGIALFEKTVITFGVARKLRIGWRDLSILQNTAKIAAASVLAGAATFGTWFLISQTSPPLLTLFTCAAVFAPVYLLAVYFLNAVPNEEKERFFNFLNVVKTKIKKLLQPKSDVNLRTTENPKSKI